MSDQGRTGQPEREFYLLHMVGDGFKATDLGKTLMLKSRFTQSQWDVRVPLHDTLQKGVGFDLETRSSEENISGSFLNASWSTLFKELVSTNGCLPVRGDTVVQGSCECEIQNIRCSKNVYFYGKNLK